MTSTQFKKAKFCSTTKVEYRGEEIAWGNKTLVRGCILQVVGVSFQYALVECVYADVDGYLPYKDVVIYKEKI